MTEIRNVLISPSCLQKKKQEKEEENDESSGSEDGASGDEGESRRRKNRKSKEEALDLDEPPAKYGATNICIFDKGETGVNISDQLLKD